MKSRRRRDGFAGWFAIACVLFAVSPAAGDTPIAGQSLLFEVQRDGVPVGQHRVNFTRDGEELRVETVFDLSIKLFALTLYSLEYTSQARWRDGRLLALKSRTDDDGTVSSVAATRIQDAFQVTGPDGTQTVDGDLIPTNHWNVAVTASERVLNTITGKVNAVRMRDFGLETVEAEGRNVEARRWAYTGDLQNEVWYDGDGRWVKMRFLGRDGSTIEYVCLRCLGTKRLSTDR